MLLSLPSVSAGYLLYFRSVSGPLARSGSVRRLELFKSAAVKTVVSWGGCRKICSGSSACF